MCVCVCVPKITSLYDKVVHSVYIAFALIHEFGLHQAPLIFVTIMFYELVVGDVSSLPPESPT